MNRDVEEMHTCICERVGIGGELNVDPAHVAVAKTVEGREVATGHSPSIAHQATINPLECHCSRKKRENSTDVTSI